MTRRLTATFFALCAVAVVGTGTSLGWDDSRAASSSDAVDHPVTVVQTGRVTWVDSPLRFGLEGGWTVELAEPAPWIADLATWMATGGEPPVLKVIGTSSPSAGERLIQAGGIEASGEPAVTVREVGRLGHRGGPRETPRRPAAAVGLEIPVVLELSDGDARLRGFILEFTVDGFRMIAEGSVFDVVVTEDTEFEGFEDLAELSVGDEVEVRGELQGSTMVASRVKLRSSDEARIRGVLAAFIPAGLVLDADGIQFEVVVTPDTELYNFGSLQELSIGDEIEARGALSGFVLTATRIELLEQGVDFEYLGRLAQLLPPDSFVMDDGRTYTVDASTVYDPELGGYGGLAVGQYLEVESRRGPSGRNLVIEIEYKGESQSGQGYRELEGIIEAVSPIELRFDNGGIVALTPATRFVGDADSVQEVSPGWEAEVYALLDQNSVLTALEVRSDDREAATTGGQVFEPQQALVVPVTGASADDIAGRFGAQVVGRVGGLGALLWFAEVIDDNLLAALDADPDVAAVEPNYLFQDPESVRRRYPTVDRRPTTEKLVGQTAMQQLGLPGAQQLTTGNGVVVAVIDTGVDPLHPALRRRLLEGGLDMVDGDLMPWEERDFQDGDGDGDVDEAAGHGTFVASLIGIAAPEARILPYRVLDDEGSGTAYDLAVALADAIERRVDVINLSLVYQERSSAVDLLLERAARVGIVVVTSAGNDASTSLPFPASDSNTLAVAALAEDGTGLAPFSNRSHLVGLAAPGEAIFGALDEQQFGTWSGTSMAAPFVSGAAALLLGADPGLDPALIENALRQSGIGVQDGDWTGTMPDVLAAVTLVWGGP